MSKDPAFLFYPGDWLGGTLGMTFEEKGAYMELLMLQFNRGHMTTHMIGQVVGQLWVTLQVKFKQDEHGLWYNERLDEEKEKRKNFVKSRKNNIKGKNQYTKHKKNTGHMNGHMTSHMENENENENINTIKIQLFSDEIWLESIKLTHKGKNLDQAWNECYLHHSQSISPPSELWEWKQKFNTWLSIKKQDFQKEPMNKYKLQ